MRGHRGGLGVVAAAVLLVASVPFLVGQGCQSLVDPVNGGIGNESENGGVGGNVAPSFRFTAPVGTVEAQIGDVIPLTWSDSDPDDDAQITILLDPDANPNNGNEKPIAAGISEDDPTNAFSIDTAGYGLTPGLYSIVARISDGVNPEVMVAAAGQLNLNLEGSRQTNLSPSVVVTQPVRPLSVTDRSTVDITYCGNDRDNGIGGVIADVLIMLDADSNPLNDVFATNDAAAIAQICSGNLPADVGGAVVLGCAKDDKCTNPTLGTTFTATIDANRIPMPAGGEPYRVRVSMWDHANPPVSAYASGTVSVTTLASGVVDLGKVGRTTTGARFIGFDTGAQAGFTGVSLGDFDNPQDLADDFVLVARFGRPFERGPVGSAYLVYGTPGQRFGSDIFLNSYGTEYRGCGFASGHAGPYYRYNYLYTGDESEVVTDGIVAVTSIEDLSGDSKPEILFGLPYAEGWWDNHDDDPCDKADLCYFDGMPNPYSTDKPDNDDISAWDYRESLIPEVIDDVTYYWDCSNDGDYSIYTPLNQGYIVYVSSDNQLEDTILDIAMAGQNDPDGVTLEEGTLVSGASTPAGARLRGGWYSFAATDTGMMSFDPYNQFGKTLGTMPDLGNGGTVPVKDGRSEFLISLPNAYDKRGAVILNWGMNLANFGSQPVRSIPFYARTVDPCTRVWFYPDSRPIEGAKAGDEFGYANRAGDFNRDGHQDILAGAPGSDNGGIVDAGTVYVIFGRLDFGDVDLSKTTDPTNPQKQYVPRIELRGTNNGDRFGEVQTNLGDVNNDGYNDIAFASKLADGPGGADSGYVGIVFGGRAITGELVYEVNRVGTPQLPGCALFGSQRGGHAGQTISNIGDFNGDNIDDLMISAPDEVRMINGQPRRGVAYIVFGGPHLANSSTKNFFVLDQVGSKELPGIVFVSPYTQATADEATINWVGAAGDVDGDGFADVLLGLSEADFVNPLDPSQRRIDAGEAYLVYGNNSGGNKLGK